MIPSPALQDRVSSYLKIQNIFKELGLVSFEDFAAEPRRKQVMG